MESHPDIAKGFSKGDKIKQDELWSELARELNACGPPTRDVAAWKKTWCDWRRSIKTRLAENKSSLQKTGGGDFQQHYLSPVEEQLAIICDIFHAVEGISMAKSFGAIKTKNKENVIIKKVVEKSASESVVDELQATTSAKSFLATPEMSPQRKRKRFQSEIDDILGEETKNFQLVASKIEATSFSLENHTRQLKNINRALEDIRSIKKKEYEEKKRHNLNMERLAKEKNELKLEFLKLEKLKMGILEE